MAPPTTLCVVSDLHFMAWKDTNEPVEWVPQLVKSLADCAALKPSAFIFNGDLTNGKERDYRWAMNSIAEQLPAETPQYFTMGNHEYYGYYEDDPYSYQLAQHRFLQFTKQDTIYFEVRQPAATLIFLSPEKYIPDQYGDAAWLSETQLAWFAIRLERAPKKKPVLVFLHQPIDDTVADSNHYCVQSPEIREILQTRPQCAVFSGHTHCRMDRDDQLVEQNGTVFIGGGALCTEHPQSRWVTIDDDGLHLSIRDHRTNDWTPTHRAHVPLKWLIV